MRRVMLLGLIVSVVTFFAAGAQADDLLIASGTGSQQTGEGFEGANGILTDGKCVLTVRNTGEGEDIEFTYKLQCFDITGVTQAHIHVLLEPDDPEGPVSVFLCCPQPSDPSLLGPILGTGDIDGLLGEGSFGADRIAHVTPEEFNDLMHNDGAYLNVHTAVNQPGEVRGQIVAIDDSNIVDEFFLATATGSQQRPDTVTTDASCIASFRVKGENLKYKLKCFNIEGVTQAHIHLSPAQSANNFVVFLFPFGNPTGPINGKIVGERVNPDTGETFVAKSSGTLRSEDLINQLAGATIADLVEEMRKDNAYLNVHTNLNPPGEVRGQITVVETLAGGF